MDLIQSPVEQIDCVIKALSFCDDVPESVRAYAELSYLIADLVVELYADDIRIRFMEILQGYDDTVSV